MLWTKEFSVTIKIDIFWFLFVLVSFTFYSPDSKHLKLSLEMRWTIRNIYNGDHDYDEDIDDDIGDVLSFHINW